MLSDNSLTPEDADALEKIILKLQAEGKITHIPESLSTGTTLAVESKSEGVESTQAEQADTVSEPVAESVDILASWDDPVEPGEIEAEESVEEELEVQVFEEDIPESTLVGTTASSSTNTNADLQEPTPKTDAVQEAEDEQPDEWADWDSPNQTDEPLVGENAIVVTRKTITPGVKSQQSPAVHDTPTPWVLQQFFEGDIDLDVELQKRFPFMPLMVTAKFRTLGSQSRRRVATLTAADSSASLIIDADMNTKVVQLSFTFGSMLTLRFSVKDLSNIDRTRWLELMQREQGGLAFLWGPTRWQDDYMICISRTYGTNFYAFSPNNFEAAIRLTPTINKQLLDWLDAIWSETDSEDETDSPLLTW